MDHRRFRVLPILGAVIAALSIAACGGGGSGSATPPVTPTAVPTTAPSGKPTATPTPGTTATPTSNPSSFPTIAPSPCATAPCSLAIGSNPMGLAVTISGSNAGVTPVYTAPPFAASPIPITVGASGYTVTVNQTGSASRIIFYNQVMDTGNVTMTGNQSVARSAASIASASSAGSLKSRGLAQFNRSPAIATTGIYVRYDASKLTQSIPTLESRAGARGAFDILSSVAAVRGRVVLAQAGSDVRTLAASLASQPGVIGVYPLHYRVPMGTATPTLTTINDAQFGISEYQWDLDDISARYAWSLTPSRGSDAKIAILDTGVDLTHPDLENHIIYNATFVNGASYINQPSSNPNSAQDTNGHGTNVTGIAAAQADYPTGAQGYGFAGVAYNAQILAYRIFPSATSSSDDQSADTGDEARAIADAVSQHADVINLSLGSAQYDPSSGTGFDQAEHDAIEAAIAAGVSVVAAAGNGDSNNVAQPTLDFPAGYDGVISVGSSAIIDNNAGSWNPATGTFSGTTESVASYSNYGPNLSVVAPGGDTLSNGDSSTSDNLHWIVNDSTQTAAYGPDQCTIPALPSVCGFKFEGTSQATPHVTGTVALVQSARRENGLAPLSPAAMLALIEGTADNINSAAQGHGRLNTMRAVAGALGVQLVSAPTPPPSSPTQFVAFAYTNSGQTGVAPKIADVTYPTGVPLTSSSTFRIADINPAVTTGTFKIAVWLDANGDGIVDAGDQFGYSTITCTANAPCNPGTIAVSPVTSTITLP
jgi:subtilisin family serine protease